MPRKHVQLNDSGSFRERIFVHTEAIRVGKVMRQLAMQLEDVAIAYAIADRNLGF